MLTTKFSPKTAKHDPLYDPDWRNYQSLVLDWYACSPTEHAPDDDVDESDSCLD
jgi:hypothetical protein